MTGRLLALLAAVTTIGGAASAQSVAIGDDGWALVDRSAKLNYRVVVKDDGWERADKTLRPMSAARAPGSPCTQLERSLGQSGAQCGTMTLAELSRAYIDRND